MNYKIQHSYPNKSTQLRISYLRFIYCFLFLVIYFPAITFSQGINATAKLDATTIKIGDQVKLHLTVQRPLNMVFNWATPPDSMNGIEVVETSKMDTLGKKDSEVITQTQTLTLTSFDSGYYPIPPFIFHYKKDKDTNDYTVQTQALLLTVTTIPIDTAKGFKGIKNRLDANYSFGEFWEVYKWYVLSGIATILIIAGLLVYFLTRKKVVPIFVEKVIKRPAHEIALEALKKTEDEKLWQNGFVKKYYSEISDIIRTYIENRYNVIAMELTTDEILYHFNRVPINTEAKDKLTRLLQLSDLVKFAKVQPLPNEHDLCIANAYSFIQLTMTKEEPSNQIIEPKEEK
jgi:hypothetical protein